MATTYHDEFGATPSGGAAVGGYAGVKSLQEALRKLAFATGNSKVDPAQYDGKMTLGTMIAVANAAPVIGSQVDSSVHDALNIVEYIKKPISYLPYGSTIIELVLAPWIIDKVFSAILGIIKLVPGGGSTASTISKGVEAVKSALAKAAAPITPVVTAAALKAKPSGFGNSWFNPGELAGCACHKSNPQENFNGLFTTTTTQILSNIKFPPLTQADIDKLVKSGGPNPPAGYTWNASPPPGHWERLRIGQTPIPGPGGAGTIVLRDCRTGSSDPNCAPGGISNTPTTPRVLPPPPPGMTGITREHRQWPHGKQIVSADWSRTHTYFGKALKADLNPVDLHEWEKHKDDPTPNGDPKLSVAWGAQAFLIFQGNDGARLGAFWDERTQMLKIAAVPEPSTSQYPWDYGAEAVVDFANTVADVAVDTWNWVAEHADEVWNAVKKYGCVLVNNDILVAATAAGTGIIASPAASAAVVSGAGAGKAACAVMEVAEVLYAIYQLLSMDIPKIPSGWPATTSSAGTAAGWFKPVIDSAITKIVLPPSKPVVPLAQSRYPIGSITAYDPTIKKYRIAIPIGTKVTSGGKVGGKLAVRNFQTLTPLTPKSSSGFAGSFEDALAQATHSEVEQSDKAPIKVEQVPLRKYRQETGTQLPAYKDPWFWLVIGAGAVVVSGAGYVVYRRRKQVRS